MVLTTVEHLNQAKAEATGSERCAIKTEETGTGTANEEGANTSTTGEISNIGSSSVSNANVDSISMAYGSGEAAFGDSGSITVASGNAQQQTGSIDMASSSIKRRVTMPRRSKRVPKGLRTTKIGGEESFDQDVGGHDIDMVAIDNNDRHVVGQEVQRRKTSDGHNSDIAEIKFNQESNAVIRSNDMDNSTTGGVTRKRNAEDSSLKSRKKGTAARNESFEGRFKQLIDFIDEFGHCHVPCKSSMDPSLGRRCSNMRSTYKKIQQGQKPKCNLTQDQIDRLEEIGFKLELVKAAFEQRCHDLEVFKSEFGHCHVPYHYSANPSLGAWCNTMRCAYNKIQQGQKPKCNLTQDQIDRLKEIGFKWELVKAAFEQRCHDLEALKSEFGHCNVSRTYSAVPLLGKWCSEMRCAYNKIQQGLTPRFNLTQDQIARLEEIGFKWKVQETFEQRYYDLQALKSEFGPCNVPIRYSTNPSLGQWCSKMRSTHNKIQQGHITERKLTQDQIARLEEIGFKEWKVK